MIEQKEIARGFTWTSITQVVNIVFRFLSLVILSRILSPKEYGLLAIIMIFIEIGNMICDSGMGGSLIKKKECKHIDYDTLFIYNIAVCGCIYAILWVVAPFIADFYNEEIVTMLIRVASLQIVIRTVYTPQYIHVLKDLDFKNIAVATLCAALGGLTIAVIAAYSGLGVWSFVAQSITEAVVFFFYFSIKVRYIPKLQFSKASFHEQFTFGINLLGANMLNTIGNNIYNNIVAKVVDLRSTGFFVQATRIQNLPISVTNNVIDVALFPILSKCKDSSEFKTLYYKVYGIILMGICYIAAFISFFSTPIVDVLLGSQWHETSPILRVLSLSIIPYAIFTICRNALKSQGYTFAILKNQIIKTIVLLSALIVATIFGFWYVVTGVVVAHTIAAISILATTCRLTGLSLNQHLRIIVPFVMWSIFSAIITTCLVSVLSQQYAFLLVVVSLIISFLIYSLCLYLSHNSSFGAVFDLLMSKIKK